MVLLSIFLGAINSPSTYKFPTHNVKSLLRFFLSFLSFSNPSRLIQSHLLGSCNSSPNWVKVLPFINKQIHQNLLLFFSGKLPALDKALAATSQASASVKGTALGGQSTSPPLPMTSQETLKLFHTPFSVWEGIHQAGG